ncbi:hypothetical protein A2V71_04770 [Candidatus Berkelbacteria bacterium RBG_13_40_8]|uniref:Glycosyl transferase family 1 n=1 Tax=Candidatus Berkelbacteria bacterium RBG_13_40_8 TaxID=1797467 RepID=A0A1F5DMP6_9BACT|nr:MAG: hypothetical protein A2V71_04770 [Candidatus Berkelbacteria bacterium RBG_13_40_8]
MKIGIFTECYHPVMNGVVVSIDTFKTELEKRGHEFYIFTTECQSYDETDNHIHRFQAITRTEPKGGSYPISKPQNVNNVAESIRDLNLDLIHSQHLMSTGSLGLKVAQRLGIPAVLTYHTLLTEYIHYIPILKYFIKYWPLNWMAKKWVIRKSRNYCNQYDAIVTPSPSMKKLLIEYGVKTQITPIPTGIDLSKFQNQYSKKELKAKYKIPEEQDFIFLYVSRIGKEKNIYFLLETMRKLIKEKNYSKAHLLLVGGGDELEKAKNLIKKWGLEKHFTFTGGLPHEEVIKVFGGADCFVFSSVTETQGIIIQEAQASGLPVIAVNIMGPSDYIKDGIDGFLVPLNINQFTDIMIHVIMMPEDERKKMGENAKRNVQEYTAEKSAIKMEKLYESTKNNYRSQ